LGGSIRVRRITALMRAKQFARRKGFGHVIVRAHLQADDPIGLVVARGQHHDRHCAMLAGAQVAREREPIFTGHHHVEHDEVDGVRVQHRAHLAAVGHRGGAQAVLLQVVGDHAADLAVVVDDQDVVDVLHVVVS
jgi:hypothetical protein